MTNEQLGSGSGTNIQSFDLREETDHKDAKNTDKDAKDQPLIPSYRCRRPQIINEKKLGITHQYNGL